MKIAVYGLGRFGTFWASVLSDNFNVSAYSRSKKNPPVGVELILHESQLIEYDTIFLCCSISGFEEVVKRINPHIKQGATVIDTCSVKVEPARLMKEYLPNHCGKIATHPMFGPDSGKNGISGLPLVFYTIEDVQGCGTVWENNFKILGLDIKKMTPDQHDKEAAFTQGITHFIGRVLKELELSESPIATKGYNKLLEIIEQTCNDPLQLFFDLQKYNHHTGEMRVCLKKALDDTMRMF